jgi:hypothetical protein
MDLNQEQTEKATKLLGLFCESNNLDNVQVSSFFDNDNEEAAFICKKLEIDDLLKVTWADGNRIAGIDKKEGTCNAFKNDTLMKEFMLRDRMKNKEQLETDVLKLQKENLEKSSIIRLDVFELVNRQPILNYRISVVDKIIASVDNKDVPKKGVYKAIDAPVIEKLVLCNLTDIEKFEFGSQLTHKFQIKKLGWKNLYINLTSNDLIKLGFIEPKQVIGKYEKLWIWIKKFHKAILWVLGGILLLLSITVAGFEVYDRLNKQTEQKESIQPINK